MERITLTPPHKDLKHETDELTLLVEDLKHGADDLELEREDVLKEKEHHDDAPC